MRRLVVLALLAVPGLARGADVRCVIARGPASGSLVFDQMVFSDLIRGPRQVLIRGDNTVDDHYDPAPEVSHPTPRRGARKSAALPAVVVGFSPGPRDLTINTSHVDGPGGPAQVDAVFVGDATRTIQIYDGHNRLAIHCGREH